ncbi:TRAP transporter substrate-binding protein [Bacillus sp. OK048]|uniref:TRAP transporter substrate-binding protein n=1 Tax=Bacillus sp. OK048 TaxID=1882761 RepID=UPI00088478B8|nr:TRAP transporter substrate-binding protein [Bacillus sp. OK048]SDN71106.1 tripartite ATP-independent transporter solute receptor, DctP family [Bacillus sp. OK048]
MKKKFGIFTLLMIISLLIAGCNSKSSVSSSDEKKVVIKIANNFGTDHPHNVALREKFKTIAEKESDGSLEIKIYESNQLGAELAAFDGVRNGTIEMAIAGTTVSGNPEKIKVGDWPFLFEDLEHAKKAYTGEVGKEIAAELQEKTGVKVLGWAANGFRSFSSNKSIESMKDFETFRLRMPDLPEYISIGKALNAEVISLPFSEIFTALEQHVADGQDNPVSTVVANGFYEVQDHILLSNHVFSPSMYVMNADLYENKLTDKQRSAIDKAAQESTEYQWKLYGESLEKDIKTLKEHGVKVTEPSKDFRQDMVDAMGPFFTERKAKYPWAKDILKKIEELK